MTDVPIGELRHRLALERVVRNPDGGGGVTSSWVQEALLWARVQPSAGREGVEAARIAGRVSHEIALRYRAGVEPEMRFRLGTRIFEILAVIDVGERGAWLRCLCEEREL